MASPNDLTKILQENLHLVFGEKDSTKRLTHLSRLWGPSTECVFIDPLGLFRSHEAISNLISTLHERYPGRIFTELGPVQVLYESDQEDFRVARLPWGYGVQGEDVKITGEDVATVIGGRIFRLYTFIDE